MIETIQLRLQGFPEIPPADLRLPNGRIYGLFDAGDGAASALLAALAGAELPAAGAVRVGGFDTAAEPVPAGRCVGYCADSTGFYDRMTVWELLTFVTELRGEGGSKAARDIHTILEDLELDDLRNVMLCRLGIDERRRVGLAQTLVGNPGTILLDDPTKGLRTTDAAALREDIRRAAENGKTVFLASDNATELLELCDRFLFVDSTGITPPLEKDALSEAPLTPALKVFLGLRTKNEPTSAAPNNTEQEEHAE